MTIYYGLNRTLDDVLVDMRSVLKHPRYSKEIMESLIEEAQVMGNRMSSALQDVYDVQEVHDALKESRAKLRKVKSQLKTEEAKVTKPRTKSQ